MAVTFVVGTLLVSCGSDSTQSSDTVPPASATPDTSTQSIDDPAVPTQIREDQMPTYTMVMQFLSQTIASSPGLREQVENVEEVALCMVSAGYQINNIPPPDAEGAPTTVVPPETMISPMLQYLTESCTGIPASDWLTD
jgi:hypothetical protein